MQSLEHSSDRFRMPSDPTDAPEPSSNRYLKNKNCEKFQSSGKRPGRALGARLGQRLGPAARCEYDMLVK